MGAVCDITALNGHRRTVSLASVERNVEEIYVKQAIVIAQCGAAHS